MTRRFVTIKDIAKNLGISVATVSRALRNAYDVSEDTRERVIEAAKKMNYRPNFNATGLVKNSTHKIAVIIPWITNYYFSTVITGIQEFALANDYQIILYLTDDSPEWEVKVVNELSPGSVDGVIACITSKTTSFEHFEDLINAGLPITFFDRSVKSLDASTVLQDDYNGACLAVEHLIENGYRKIAHITGPKELSITQNRLRGYLDTLNKHGLNPAQIIYSGFGTEEGEKDINLIWENKELPDAIFAVNDRKAIGAILGLKKRGIQVGKEVGVIGFTNDPISEIITPRLTTIAEPAFEIGRTSCQLLIKHIQKDTFPKQKIILPSTLIIRESTKRN